MHGFWNGLLPSCNPDMWQGLNVLDHMVPLSDFGTTFASFSVAGHIKTWA